MRQCPHCGADLSESDGECERCGASPDSGVTRRGMLAYGGGSALLTWAGFGLGWFIFFHEPTGPEEDVVREYMDALDRSHFFTASQLFHEDAPDSAPTAADIPDVDRMDIVVEDTEVADRGTDIEHDSVEELSLVRVELTLDSGLESRTIETSITVALNADGEWKIWRDRH